MAKITAREVNRLGMEYENSKRIWGEWNLETDRRLQKYHDAIARWERENSGRKWGEGKRK